MPYDPAVCSLSVPRLSRGQLYHRLRLIRRRLQSFPLDSADFVMMDLERPDASTRMADWCTGDLTGRILEFLCCAQGVDGVEADFSGLFERILRTKTACGLYGRYGDTPGKKGHEEFPASGANKLFWAMMRAYELSGDARALEAARDIGDYLIAHASQLLSFGDSHTPVPLCFWVTEPFARLYHATGEKKYLDMLSRLRAHIGPLERSHSHGLLSTLRGLQTAAMLTGDMEWNELPERLRRQIIERDYVLPDGDICEYFPRSGRNEGCSIADWLMLNLNAGYLTGDDDAYERAEHILYNALSFNQIVTGGLGHRAIVPEGYGSREFEEAWWCCTENGGVAMTEYARHAVTRRGNTIRVNLLVPGTFRLPVPDGEVCVRISTVWPQKPEAVIAVTGLPEEMTLTIRVPSCIKSPHIEERRQGGCGTWRLSGKMGYSLVPWNSRYPGDAAVTGKSCLMYGPLILAPSCYTWEGHAFDNASSTVPEGYIPAQFPTRDCSIVAPAFDEDGFRRFSHEPFPDWCYFEEGPDSRTGVGEVSAHVTLQFPDGSRQPCHFWPLCYSTSTLCFNDVPILFGVLDELAGTASAD